MIQEDYVSFETAKLLKEKGFNEKCISTYNLVTGIFEVEEVYQDWTTRWKAYVSAPTLQMAMKWLREKEIFVEITHDIIPFPTYKYHYSVFRTEPEFYYSGDVYDSYEEACETAIKYCLNNLI